MSRRTKTLLPMKNSLLKPNSSCFPKTKKQLKDNKLQQKKYYDRGAKDLKPLEEGETIRVQPNTGSTTNVWKKGVVNPKNNDVHNVEFLVVSGDCIPLLGNKTIQIFDLININYDNILTIKQRKPLEYSVITSESSSG